MPTRWNCSSSRLPQMRNSSQTWWASLWKLRGWNECFFWIYQVRKEAFQEKVQLADKESALILVVGLAAKHGEQDLQFSNLCRILGHFHNSFNDLFWGIIYLFDFLKSNSRSGIRRKHPSNCQALSVCCLPSMGHGRQEQDWQRSRQWIISVISFAVFFCVLVSTANGKKNY